MSSERLLFRWREALMAPAGPPPTERHVLLTLSTDADTDGGNCYPSTRRLAERTGLARRTVETQLRNAEARGWIQRRAHGEGQGWRRMAYTLTLPNVEQDLPHLGLEGGEARSPRGCARVAKDVPHPGRERGETDARRGETDDTNVGNDVPLTSPVTSVETSLFGDSSPLMVTDQRDFPPLAKLPRQGRERVYPPEFEGAFTAMPRRHIDHPKAAAYQAWRARARDVEEIFQLEAAALAYADDVRAKGKEGSEYVLMASTFFGPGERFRPHLGRPIGGTGTADANFVQRELARLGEFERAGGVLIDA